MSAMAPRSMLNAVLMAARFQFRTSLSIPCLYPRVPLNRFGIASKNSFRLDIWKSSEQANLKPLDAERFFSNCTRNKIWHRVEGLLSAKLVPTLSSSLGASPILFFPPPFYFHARDAQVFVLEIREPRRDRKFEEQFCHRINRPLEDTICRRWSY